MYRSSHFTPRWLFRFFQFIEDLPFSLWFVGLTIVLLGGLAMHLDAWRKGLIVSGEFNRYLASVSLFNVGYPAIWIYLDRRAKIALENYYTDQSERNKDFKVSLANFISLPSFQANSVFLVGILFGLVYLPQAKELQPLIGLVLPLWDYFSWIPISGFIFMLIFRTLRQTLAIPRFFDNVQIDVFNPSRVYSLSRYSSQAAITLFIVNYALVFSSVPGFLTSSVGIVYNLMIGGTSLIVFFAPLAGINQRLREQKEGLLAEIRNDQKTTQAKIHIAVKDNRLMETKELREVFSSLKDQYEVVKNLSPWPWQPEVIRNLLAPVIFPIFVYLVQSILGSLFGFR